MKTRRPLLLAMLAAMLMASLFVVPEDLWGRAGGAGGSRGSSRSSGGSSFGRSSGSYSSSSGGSGEISGVLVDLVILMVRVIGPIPTVIIFVGGTTLVIIIARRKVKKMASVLQNLTTDPPKKAANLSSLQKADPAFDEAAFLEKAKKAFMDIQDAWVRQDLSKVRRFISDGVYQRFNTQFVMMKTLKQSNVLSDVNIQAAWIDRYEADNSYDVLHVGINATMQDEFRCECNHALNQKSYDDFVEYWSFLRKRGAAKKDLYASNTCPGCDAPLPEQQGELSKCQYCGAISNSGDYDWVLAEITQADDYTGAVQISKSGDVKAIGTLVAKEMPEFSVQMIEDKASNAFLQLMTAVSLKDQSRMRRFTTDELFAKAGGWAEKANFVYNRIFLNDVTLFGIGKTDTVYRMFVSISVSYQRAQIEGAKCKLLDPAIITETQVMVMDRSLQSSQNKGSVYMHSCPACGAPVQDSLDLACTYCGSALNSPTHEFIASDLLTIEEYGAFAKANQSLFMRKFSPTAVQGLYEVKDYALNNIYAVMGADGQLTSDEQEWALALAKQWGYNKNTVQPLVDLAVAGRLVIRMPEDVKKRQQIFELMTKAAMADNQLSPEEETILNSVRDRYLAV